MSYDFSRFLSYQPISFSLTVDLIQNEKEEIPTINISEELGKIQIVLEYIPETQYKHSRILYFLDFTKQKNILIVKTKYIFILLLKIRGEKTKLT